MTTTQDPKRLRFSVIVASHQRPWWLKRCLTALRQLDHPAFEIVIVADSDSLKQLEGDDFKGISHDAPGLSRARNMGIAEASGDVCAFIDDDAVPEPRWLAHHEDALHKTGADACVGYVRGRNGISFQSRVESIDAEGETHREPSPDSDPFIPELKAGRALKLIGTNTVLTKNALAKLGGFDSAYAFYMDDSDISLRVAQMGMTAAVAPFAEVHHAFAPSVRRTDLRAPTDLGDIGRSMAIFMRRHRGIAEKALFERVCAREKTRLLRHMVQGTCEPSDISLRMAGLVEGWQAGLTVQLPKIELTLSESREKFRKVAPLRGHAVVTSRLIRRKKRMAEAEKLAQIGQRASIFSFSLTPVRHLVRYSDSGVWVQTGGQFGRTDREDRLFRWCRFAERAETEIRRVAKQRGI